MPDKGSDAGTAQAGAASASASPLDDLTAQALYEFSLENWPDSKLLGSGNSDIACLIVTIKHLFSFLTQTSRNELLRIADEEDQKKHESEPNKAGMLRAILQQDAQKAVTQIKDMLPKDTVRSFKSLIFSQPLVHSLWKHSHFQFYAPRRTTVIGREDDPRYQHILQPPLSLSEEAHVTWDGAPGKTLSEHISWHFGSVKT